MNKVILMGRLTKDPDIKYVTDNNIACCKFSIAVPRIKKDEADFLNCVAWRQTGEIVAKYFTKGARILVEGAIQTRNYEKDGQKIYITEILVSQVHFCESKKNNNSDNIPDNYYPGNYENGDGANLDDNELPFQNIKTIKVAT